MYFIQYSVRGILINYLVWVVKDDINDIDVMLVFQLFYGQI